MQQFSVSYPDDLAEAVQLTPDEFAAMVRLMAAIKMFELGQLSSGVAAKLAGLSRVDFVEACSRYQVPAFNYPAEALETELRSDLEAIQKSL